MPQSLRPRNGRTKSHEPRARMVRKPTIATTSSRPRMISTRAGVSARMRVSARLAKLFPPPEQKQKEDGGTDDTENGAGRDLVGEAHETTNDVGGKYEGSAGQSDPGNGTAHVVA